MARRIGNYLDEKTGDIHWLEPETVKHYPLPAGRIAEMGRTGYRTIAYALSSNEAAKTIELVASVELSTGDIIYSDASSMNEVTFADLLFDSFANDVTFANQEEVKEFMESTHASLAFHAYDKKGIVLNGLSISGFGSVFYGDDRIAVFDGITVAIEGYDSQANFSLINTVSQAVILEEKLPEIQFIAHKKSLKMPLFSVNEVRQGIVSQYEIKTNSIVVEPSLEKSPLVHVYNDDVAIDSPYMSERTALLASAEIEDDSFEDRFGDIFQL